MTEASSEWFIGSVWEWSIVSLEVTGSNCYTNDWKLKPFASKLRVCALSCLYVLNCFATIFALTLNSCKLMKDCDILYFEAACNLAT